LFAGLKKPQANTRAKWGMGSREKKVFIFSSIYFVTQFSGRKNSSACTVPVKRIETNAESFNLAH
jgi:hypothetical protein